ncbi:pentatricopeptide repeat-containing protein At5g18475-like [Lathyrus oleraceus]|uniref:pentatricopeptide repeat-containing protein At5g18475-like n=1 Tax=Pisum sativum TaxID=3888 RepID=UPI0021CECAD7|nr:pentatricopeptide repeat-containing protein At5g18475-like [Pisum sativum]
MGNDVNVIVLVFKTPERVVIQYDSSKKDNKSVSVSYTVPLPAANSMVSIADVVKVTRSGCVFDLVSPKVVEDVTMCNKEDVPTIDPVNALTCQSDCVDEVEAQGVFGYALYKDEKTPSLSYPLENFDSNVYGRSFQGNIGRARNVIEFMKNDRCCTNSALVDGLYKAGKPKDAKGVLAEMKNFVLKPDTVTYTSLINFFCRNGQIDEAIELLKEMKENECEDDTVTFNVILGGLSREGRFDEALDMIEKLPRQGVY